MSNCTGHAAARSIALMTSDGVVAGIRERFNRVKEAKKHADESVEKGRAFVEAYVEYTHYVERLAADAGGAGGHDGGIKEEHAAEHHH